MVAYWRLKWAFKDLPRSKRRKRILDVRDGLLRLREVLRLKIPIRKSSETVLLATWNIRNFDDNRFGHGPRLPESFFYIAEILSAFDIVAVQEIGDDLGPLERLLDMLGPDHDFIVTDVTLGPGGNRERLGFIYDRNKVSFTGTAGELVLPFKDQISDGTRERQFARTPFACTFRSGWFKFNFATVHIYFGKASRTSAEYARRVAEIDKVAQFTAKRARKDKEQAHILVGDFNIEDFEGETFDALDKHGFKVFRNKLGSNLDQNSFYDQISFMPDPDRVVLADKEDDKDPHGVFNPFLAVFREEDFDIYDYRIVELTKARKAAELEEIAELELRVERTDLAESTLKKARSALNTARENVVELEAMLADPALRKAYYLNDWRTFQISDHFPLYVELKVDFTEDYLENFEPGEPES